MSTTGTQGTSIPEPTSATRGFPAPLSGASRDTLYHYFAWFRRVPLLTTQQELELCREIDAAYADLEAARETGADRARLERLARRAHELRERLIVANLRLVVAVARRYQHTGLPLEDLVQEGNLGLMKATERFEYRRGFRFSTYATWWIRQAMTAAIASTGRTIRLPTNVLAALRRVAAAHVALTRELGRAPTFSELAVRAGMAQNKVEELLRAGESPAPLGEPAGGGMAMTDVLPDRGRLDPEASAVEADQRRALAAGLRGLDQRERLVLELRFGLRGGREHTLEEVGRSLGVTRKVVRKAEERALKRLRLRARRTRHLKVAC